MKIAFGDGRHRGASRRACGPRGGERARRRRGAGRRASRRRRCARGRRVRGRPPRALRQGPGRADVRARRRAGGAGPRRRARGRGRDRRRLGARRRQGCSNRRRSGRVGELTTRTERASRRCRASLSSSARRRPAPGARSRARASSRTRSATGRSASGTRTCGRSTPSSIPCSRTGCPPGPTAHSGVDAMAQAIGACTVANSSPLSVAFGLEACHHVAHSLREAVADGSDVEARRRLSCASLTAGLAMNLSDCAADHALGQALGSVKHLPHGLTIGLVLAETLDADARRLRRAGSSGSRTRSGGAAKPRLRRLPRGARGAPRPRRPRVSDSA